MRNRFSIVFGLFCVASASVPACSGGDVVAEPEPAEPVEVSADEVRAVAVDDARPRSDVSGAVASTRAPETSGEPEVQGEVDLERGIVLVDGDGDTYPDITEEIEGTDPHDAYDFPGNPGDNLPFDFQASSCASGFRQAGARLCISTNVVNARRYHDASVYCADRKASVCSYEHLRYLYVRTNLDATYNPQDKWIGNIVADDSVLCGNRSITSDGDPDIANFEGTCDKTSSRNFWCCYSDSL